jgi:protocatechuate 3,4-dioxygenase beta subunit
MEARMSGSSTPVVHRRRLVRACAGLSILVAAPSVVRAETLVPTPAQTEGPFYPVVLPADSDSDLVTVRGAPTAARGTVSYVGGRVRDTSGRVLAGAQVQIWQCDQEGIYDHPGEGRDLARRDKAFQGFGQTATGSDGAYRFRTIRPVAYPGRTPHIHFRIIAADGRRLTTQMYVAGEPGNERVGVLRAIRDERQRQNVIIALSASGAPEPGALSGTFEIVLA